MAAHFDSVKTHVVTERAYHHGDLRAALLGAALQIIEEAGPDAFSLRAAARRAGVSPAAPKHHFRDARGLLTAVATAGFVDFGNALEQATAPERHPTVVPQCHAYLRFARARPGLFRLMWRREMIDASDPGFIAAAKRAFALSDRVVRGDGAVFEPTALSSIAPTVAWWSMVHGFVSLVIDGAFFAHTLDGSGELDSLLDQALRHLELNPA